jgi:pimeloyl-ACP methyl ester carboxylesterase
MAHFVLVHGAWHGGWCWQRVVQALQLDHHRVHAVTLTGVGERAHLLSPPSRSRRTSPTSPTLIEAEELDEVVLAVHSYAGMMGTAVADRMGERLRHLVYVDAVVPRRAKAGAARIRAPRARQRMAGAQASPDYSFPPRRPEVYGLQGADHEWVQAPADAAPGQHLPGAAGFRPGAWRRCPAPSSAAPAPLPTIDAHPAARPTRGSGVAPGCRIRGWWRSRPPATTP